MAYPSRTLPDAMVVLTFWPSPLVLRIAIERLWRAGIFANLWTSASSIRSNEDCAQLQQRLPYACLCMSGNSRYRGAHHEDLCKDFAHRVEQSNASLKGHAPFVFALRLQHDICPHLKNRDSADPEQFFVNLQSANHFCASHTFAR